MIILEDADGGTKSDNDRYDGLTLRHPEQARTRGSTGSLLPDLPDYHTSEQEHRKKKARTGLLAKAHIPWIDRRIWRATLYALGIYVFLTLTIVVPITVIKSRQGPSISDYRPERSTPWDDIGLISYNGLKLSATAKMLADLDKSCDEWDTISPDTRTATDSLVMSSFGDVGVRLNATYAPKQSQSIDGQLTVLPNTNSSESYIRFMIHMNYSSPSLKDRTNVCFSRSGPLRGLNIYPPSNMNKNDKLGFNITVLLPQTYISSFVTYLPMINQHFGDLTGSHLSFESLSIQGAGRPITCEAVNARSISIANVAGAIKGTFQTSAGLTLSTIKAPIVSNITLISDHGQYPGGATLETGGSSMDVMFSLKTVYSAPRLPNAGDTPHFHPISARTFNEALNISIRYLDEDPKMWDPVRLSVRNSLGPATVSLDNRYTGTFSADTQLDQVTVNYAGSAQNSAPSSSFDSLPSSFASGVHVYPIGDSGSSHKRSSDSSTGDLPRRIEFDFVNPSQAVGWVGAGVRTAQAQSNSMDIGNLDIDAALGPVTLNFDVNDL